ncbi:uncharacterized protein LOC143212712 isoform X2 [Lasioglossum baleicum]|uniref:uncharacterized protein LOC143212712 isoform X2 n=1 Tax=Lasioglossum baleicum TaxID=434251 RepID=UPI003FCCC1FB
MEDDQQFCLRWNNHQSTLIQNFDTLLESGTLVDCTLAAEGKYLKAHKVVLSACSPYFEGLLSEHYDKHPVFILKDVKFKELKAMMDYMYRGEVNISQDQLAALLKAAESLQIKGLSESKTSGSSKTDSRQQKVVPQAAAASVDIPHNTSSGLTIERNKVPRQGMSQGSVGDLPEDSASPQVPKGLSSREGSQSPTSRKRKRLRRRSVCEDNSFENHESNSSDTPQTMGVPALGIAPVADEKTHADPTDSIGRSALMTQLTKPADEMLQLPLEKPEPNDSLIEPKSEYLEDPEESVEDLTLDDDMNDLSEMDGDNNRAGPSHDPSQHPAGIGAWHVTGDRSNAGGVVGSVAGAPGTTDEVFLAAQEAAQAHRDSQVARKRVTLSCSRNLRPRARKPSPEITDIPRRIVPSSPKELLDKSGRSRMKSEGPGSSRMRSEKRGTPRMRSEEPGSPRIKWKEPESSRMRSEKPGTSRMRSEEPGSSRMRLEKPGTPRMRSEEPGPSRMKSKEPGSSRMRLEKPGTPRMRSEEPGPSRMKSKEPGSSRMKSEKPGTPRMKSKEPGSSRMRSEKPRTSRMRSEEPGPSRMRSKDVVDTRIFSDESDTSKTSTRKIVRRSSSGSNASTSNEWVDTENCKQFNAGYICPYCNKNYYRATHLGAHVNRNCPKNPNSDYNNPDKMRPYQCECGRRFKERKLLSFHIRHECQKTVICEICNKSLVGTTVHKRHRMNCVKKHVFKRIDVPPANSNSQAISVDSSDLID